MDTIIDDSEHKEKAEEVRVGHTNIKKKNYSQYDLVKIKVNIKDHFYVFSRFLMSRVLTLVKVEEKDAVKITLEIKKELVEQSKLEIN